MKRTKERKKLKERNYRERQKNLTSHISPLTSDHEGITLIALVITIIVMLILVAVTINIVAQGKLFNYAGNAVHDTENAMKNENEIVDGKVTIGDTTYNSIDEAVDAIKGKNTPPEANGPQVTFNGETVTLTPENVAEYLGKKVTNYKGRATVGIDGTTYKVSTEYRLYYVDFGNKYKDGDGTIYLKAECTSNNYVLPTTAPSETDLVKIKELNPELYTQGKFDPRETTSVKAVKWLTNTKNWEGLKPSTYSSGIKETDINYIVGSPSLEMMMDSYNTHYKLTGEEPDTTSTLQNTQNRVKLFYNSALHGYEVGPSKSKKYGKKTSPYSVKTDAIDSMFFPGSSKYYWLASPSCADDSYVMNVRYDDGGWVNFDVCSYVYYAFCPLVSLKSSVNLTVE